MENNIIKQGYSAMTEILGGDEIVWSMEDEGQIWPDLFPKEVDVWKSYADDLMEQLRQFQNDEREFDEVDWQPNIYPVYVEIYESGKLVIYNTPESNAGFMNKIEETTIQEWRDSR